MAKIHIHIHGGHAGSRGLPRHAERSIEESHKRQGMLGTSEPKAREHDSDTDDAITVRKGRRGDPDEALSRVGMAETRKDKIESRHEASREKHNPNYHERQRPQSAGSAVHGAAGRAERAEQHHAAKREAAVSKIHTARQERAEKIERTRPSGFRPASHPKGYKSSAERRPWQHEEDADDATTRIGKTRGTMAMERGQTMQKMTAARVKNVTAAAGSTGFETNATLKGHKQSTGRAFHTAKTVR